MGVRLLLMQRGWQPGVVEEAQRIEEYSACVIGLATRGASTTVHLLEGVGLVSSACQGARAVIEIQSQLLGCGLLLLAGCRDRERTLLTLELVHEEDEVLHIRRY